MTFRRAVDFVELRRGILRELRHGPLDHFAIAQALDQAPFAVRGELHSLKRDRLVSEQLSRHGHTWKLTDRGWEIVYGDDQMRLT
jgi:predicted ArsR family transcriptional regulator